MKGGASLKEHAIVLGLNPYQEKHLIVHLQTHQQGKISALAMNARNSQKRFGGSLQVGHYVMANLNRGQSVENKLWRLDSVDLRDGFVHLRASYEAIESMSFYLSLVKELSPEGDSDPAVFVALGRMLRDSRDLDFSKHSIWSRLAFWSWWAHHAGFGDLTGAFESELRENGLEGIWHQILAQDEPNLASLFAVFVAKLDRDLGSDAEKRMYFDWVTASGLHWPHFESLHESSKRGYHL